MRKKNAILGVCLAGAMILSYLEAMLPPLTAIPGIKIGLANIAVIFVLYFCNPYYAILVSLVRVALSCLLFGNAVGLLYSLGGAVLSLLVMILLKKTKLFSVIGVSMAGGVFHNAGQIIVAVLIIGSRAIMYYLPFLIISGIISGIFVGLAAAVILKRTEAVIKF